MRGYGSRDSLRGDLILCCVLRSVEEWRRPWVARGMSAKGFEFCLTSDNVNVGCVKLMQALNLFDGSLTRTAGT